MNDRILGAVSFFIVAHTNLTLLESLQQFGGGLPPYDSSQC